jgi:hypothetical protein
MKSVVKFEEIFTIKNANWIPTPNIIAAMKALKFREFSLFWIKSIISLKQIMQEKSWRKLINKRIEIVGTNWAIKRKTEIIMRILNNRYSCFISRFVLKLTIKVIVSTIVTANMGRMDTISPKFINT